MKLYEIAPFKRPEKSEEDVYSYQGRLRQLKMKHAGSGAQAEVFHHPKFNTIVVKVSRESRLGGALAYLKYAVEHQNNPHVPKIYGIRRFHNQNSGNYFIAFIEKLTSYVNLPAQKRAAITQKYFGTDVNIGMYSNWEGFLTPENMRELRRQSAQTGVPNKYLMNLMSFLYTHSSANNNLDLHAGNIMMRGNVPVVTDPFV